MDEGQQEEGVPARPACNCVVGCITQTQSRITAVTTILRTNTHCGEELAKVAKQDKSWPLFASYVSSGWGPNNPAGAWQVTHTM